jgi:nucleotide-binding universal stress UspA family protein
MNTRILAAVDGSPESTGALRIAQCLSEGGGNDVTVLTVLESIGVYDTGPASLPPVRADPRHRQAESLRAAVLDRIRVLGAAALEDAVRVEIGPPARTIVRVAHQAGAGLIVLGLGRHGAMDRWAGHEVALQVARLAHVPVLAVPRYVAGLPRRVLVGLDFSSFSRATLRALPAVLAAGAEVHLAHVIHPPVTDPEGWLGFYSAHAPRVRWAVEQAATELELAHRIRATVHVVEGAPARSLLELADELDVELIATGSHGHGFWSRLVLGSVSSQVLRGARCAVLIVPPPELPAELVQGAAPAEALALP